MEEFTFVISEEEPYNFTMEKDGSNNLTVFTAFDGTTTYNCSIHLKSQTNELEIMCCRPNGQCEQGPC